MHNLKSILPNVNVNIYKIQKNVKICKYYIVDNLIIIE